MPVLVSLELAGSRCSVEGRKERKRKGRWKSVTLGEEQNPGGLSGADLGWAGGLGLGSLKK